MLYTDSEKVLCFHGPLIYSAKILKAEKWTGEDNVTRQVGPHYLVHYDGWKKTWDEWVPETRLLKYNDENLARKATLQEAAKSGSLTSTEKPSTSTSSASTTSAKRSRVAEEDRKTASRKRGRETVEAEEEFLKRPEVKISLPDELKLQLVDDWENITKNGLLVPLPRKPCVKDILDEYRKHYLSSKRDSKQRSPQVVDEVLKGLKLYFDRSLGQNLLYRFERAQYVEYRKKNGPKMGDGDVGNARSGNGSMGGDMEPSDVYGAEHLLRLFVNLPMIIVHTSMDGDSISLLKEHLAEFLS
ncbi:chromo domain-containing protein required for cell polarity [Pseudozyma hubeiensis SY62]|uniref:Chromatin modification-related protein EAF3 n=1 Tax=Pseudozyma hubeiensis (strain SY62) TaxID=1305764 RepID=R9P3E1_PSEHS|nr:chromo domain-containing protein required for cell polarity [Pseudozyma hubeiensis SY62]GAC95809.1 chromo domain-containing protein required for cell polarity [Pseudozyma hubeiensis SY62]